MLNIVTSYNSIKKATLYIESVKPINYKQLSSPIDSRRTEYREEVVWGNPYLRVLRSQLEQYIVEELGADYLSSNKNRTELRKIKKEMADLKKRLDELQARRSEIEKMG